MKMNSKMKKIISPRERVNLALDHNNPGRTPVDFLATVEVWEKLIDHLDLDTVNQPGSDYFDPRWEALLRKYQVDCRVLSYDQFFQPPKSFFKKRDTINWWDALSRSTPNRMFRRVQHDGDLFDLWGHHMRLVQNPTGAYEEVVSYPLRGASAMDVRNFTWPEPDWWNFDPLAGVMAQLDEYEQTHIRFRVGSVFEAAWQLTGLDKFLLDLAMDPEVPLLIMDHITDICVEILSRVLEKNSDRLDMIYFYDDVATQNSLMISKDMWKKFIKPRHTRLIDAAKKYNKKIMYHCDGSIFPLIPELIDMGVDLLNPIQVDAKNMEAQRLKDEFGDRLCFHGGIDNVRTLPFGTPQDIQEEVRERILVLGRGGGYIMASTHHIQSNTSVENAAAMYDIDLRIDQGRTAQSQYL